MWHRWRCNRGHHDYGRWTIADSTAWHGSKPIEVKIQSRECLRRNCGYIQVETVMIKANLL